MHHDIAFAYNLFYRVWKVAYCKCNREEQTKMTELVLWQPYVCPRVNSFVREMLNQLLVILFISCKEESKNPKTKLTFSRINAVLKILILSFIHTGSDQVRSIPWLSSHRGDMVDTFCDCELQVSLPISVGLSFQSDPLLQVVCPTLHVFSGL